RARNRTPVLRLSRWTAHSSGFELASRMLAGSSPSACHSELVWPTAPNGQKYQVVQMGRAAPIHRIARPLHTARLATPPLEAISNPPEPNGTAHLPGPPARPLKLGKPGWWPRSASAVWIGAAPTRKAVRT